MMSRIWMTGFMVVTLVALVKTYIVLVFVLPDAQIGVAKITGIFALFFSLTASVAYVSFTQVRAYVGRLRQEKLAPGGGDPIAKETVVLRYAPEWNLSQAEADVAIFVAKGFSNSEIAEMRGSAIATVKSQLGKIYQKSGLESRYQLIAFITDEVCGMASSPQVAQPQRSTQSSLPLNSRARSTA